MTQQILERRIRPAYKTPSIHLHFTLSHLSTLSGLLFFNSLPFLWKSSEPFVLRSHKTHLNIQDEFYIKSRISTLMKFVKVLTLNQKKAKPYNVSFLPSNMWNFKKKILYNLIQFYIILRSVNQKINSIIFSNLFKNIHRLLKLSWVRHSAQKQQWFCLFKNDKSSSCELWLPKK